MHCGGGGLQHGWRALFTVEVLGNAGHCGSGNKHSALRVWTYCRDAANWEGTVGMGAMCSVRNTILIRLNQTLRCSPTLRIYVMHPSPLYE